MTTEEVNCFFCKHWIPPMKQGDGDVCAAYPDGIPFLIVSGEWQHDRPLPDDHGIQFEQASEEQLKERV
ncbi:MAG: hypothetical protein NTV49_13565 [Kiritimatiellaeota bacterium]|nr:hypothetical protein [Kiritimatiellota bacterium]